MAKKVDNISKLDLFSSTHKVKLKEADTTTLAQPVAVALRRQSQPNAASAKIDRT